MPIGINSLLVQEKRGCNIMMIMVAVTPVRQVYRNARVPKCLFRSASLATPQSLR